MWYIELDLVDCFCLFYPSGFYHNFFPKIVNLDFLLGHRLVGVVVKDIGDGAEVLGSNPGPVKSNRYLWFVTAATFLCCPGAKSRR